MAGGGAGYAINRIALVYLSRYGEADPNYGGFVGRLFARGVCGGARRSDMLLVELFAALVSAAAFMKWGAVIDLLFLLPVLYLILLLSLIDSRIRILPNQLNLLGVALGLGYALFREGFGLYDALLGVLTGGGFSLLTALTYYALRGRDGLGFGDVKLLVFFGTLAGWMGVLVIIVAGSLLGALWGIVSALSVKTGDMMGHEIPFGPFLGAAAMGYLFFFI